MRRRSVLCRILTLGFALAYLIALALLAIGTFGLFDQPRDPLAAIPLVVLGQPWNRLADLALEASWPWLGAASPAINLVILAVVCRRR